MQFLAPPPSRFASVMPLPGDQSDASSSDKAAYTSSSESEHDHFSSDSDSRASDGDEADASSTSDSDTRRYSSDSSSDSAVSSALSFSSDTDEQHEPLDLETPLQPRYRSSRATSAIGATTSSSKDREITMQAIRNADTMGFIALLIPLTGIATMVVTETLACSYHFDCTKDYPTLSYAATFRPEGTAFMVGMCLTAFFILVSSCLFYWFLRLRMRLGDGAADAETRYTALVCLVAGIATAVTLAGLAILDMRGYHDAHIMFTVLFFISSWVLIVFCHLARRLLLLREHEREAEKSGTLLSTTMCPRLLMDGGASVWVSLKRWRRLSIPMAFTLGRLFILAGVTSTVLCKYTCLVCCCGCVYLITGAVFFACLLVVLQSACSSCA